MLEALENKGLEITEAEPDRPMRWATPGWIFWDRWSRRRIPTTTPWCAGDLRPQRFLFMGDAEKEEEDTLLATGADLRAEFIKLGHHGSRTSSQREFLQAVAPAYAAITCGTGNSYGHPHIETLQTLEELEITYARCDLNGTIKLSSDGTSISIATER